MTVAHSDFLASASVSHNAGTEIDFRNCISRSYYSIYHAALNAAELHLPDPNAHLQMGSHERLCLRYRVPNPAAVRGLSYVIETAKRGRRRADYELNDTVNQRDSQDALNVARAFPTRLAACFPAQASSQTQQVTQMAGGSSQP